MTTSIKLRQDGTFFSFKHVWYKRTASDHHGTLPSRKRIKYTSMAPTSCETNYVTVAAYGTARYLNVGSINVDDIGISLTMCAQCVVALHKKIIKAVRKRLIIQACILSYNNYVCKLRIMSRQAVDMDSHY